MRDQSPTDPAPGAPAAHPVVLTLPAIGALLRRALPIVTEGVLVPTGLFYLGFWLGGVWGGMIAALVWSLGALGRRMIVGGVSGLLVLAVVTLSVRVFITGVSGNSDVYFLQPVVGEAALGLVFLASLPAGRSLVHRLAHDFVPLEGLAPHLRLRRVFYGITLLWAGVFLLLAFLGWYLLGHNGVAAYVGYRTAVSAGVKSLAVAASVQLFRSGLRRQGIRVAFCTAA
ncbi:MAG: hypothetical protein ABIJ48_08010 [Actinomycetota bacterium]